MQADEVLSRARSANVPPNWNVWPLRRDVVLRSALGWIVTGIVGVAIFTAAAVATIPGNFTKGNGSIVLTGLVLIILAVAGFGGLGVAVYDFWRIAHTESFLLIVTPEDYVKVEPRGITHVPMEHVANVTLRGVKAPAERDLEAQRGGYSVTSHMLGTWVGNFGKPRVAPSLAFIDTRTNQEIVVCTDNTFDEMIVVEEILLIHAKGKERTYTG
ncbi:MAG TPA: hypothetical protein VKQ30_01495 [Ktedonobacterales bacterium]|nr:hypothetical protein [Ktedonobacterales bacterium]